MLYRECLSHLQRKGEELLDGELGLDRLGEVLDRLDNPQLDVPSLLIAGTNGKGSVARYAAAVAAAAGIRVGLFTSPHLVRIRERIAICGRSIDRHSFARHCSRVASAGEAAGRSLTFFETLAATAFCAFESAAVELAVLEVGLGGRLDATNVADPLVSVLTPVSLDHQDYLGETLEAIAAEKLGVLRAGRPLISAAQPAEVEEIARKHCEQLGCPLQTVADPGGECGPDGRVRFRHRRVDLHCLMRGRAQAANAALAVEALSRLRDPPGKLTAEAIRTGIGAAFSPGVVHQLPFEPPVLLDGGHNPQAARRLAGYLREFVPPPRRLLFGLMRDKDAAGVLEPLCPLFDEIVLTAVDSPRAAAPEELKQHCPAGRIGADPILAYRRLRRSPGLLVVAGSFYLAGRVAAAEGL